MNRLLGLELLRGVAATLVLLEHIRYVVPSVCGPEVALPWAIDRFDGYWGVDIFFVLSGYLIGLTLDKPGTTARSFLLARLARVLPLYVLASTLCLVLVSVLTGGLTPSMLVTTYTLMPLAGDALNPMPVHPYGWTLCYEVLFYLAATGLAAAVGGRRVVPLMVGLFVLAPLAFTAVGPAAGWAYPSFALSPLTSEFALGLLAYRLTGVLPKWAGWALLGLGVAGCVRGALADGNYGSQAAMIADPLRAWGRVARFGLPAFLVVLGTARLDLAGTFAPIARLATAAGAVSYSLYLTQPFAFLAVSIVGPLLGLTTPWPAAAAAVTVAFVLSAAVAQYVDLPLHAAAKRWVREATSDSRPAVAGPRVSLPMALGSPPR